jgi:flavin reductase (DIM6/NTAB) family NADH-FMN oxidoreductase RutF
LSRPAPSSQPASALQFDADAFRNACALYATGIAVATVRAPDGAPHGLTVNSFTSVSLQPPLILICIDYSFNFLSHFRACSNFAVNVLSESQRDLCVTFAAKPEGRFAGIDWYTNTSGAPLLPGCIAYFECRLSSIIEAGDHAIFLGSDTCRISGRPAAAVLRSRIPDTYLDSSTRRVLDLGQCHPGHQCSILLILRPWWTDSAA